MISLFSALLFYLFPTFIGCAAVRMIYKKRSLAFPAASYFVVGALIIYVVALLTKYIFLVQFPQIGFIPLFKFCLIVVLAVASFINLLLWYKTKLLGIKKYLTPLILSLILASVVTLIWGRGSPYPLNWDFLEHQTLTNNILAGRFSFFNSQITDTFIFDSYSSIFHTLLTASQLFLPIDIVDFWQNISFIHLTLVIFASYLLTWIVTGNWKIATLSAAVNAFIFESVAFTSLFFIPQTLTAVIFILLFVQLLKEIKEDRVLPFWIMVTGCFFLFLNHYIVGLVAAAILVGMYFFIKYGAWLHSKISFSVFLQLCIMASVFLILFSSLVSSGWINQGEGQFFNFSLAQKLSLLQGAYGYLLFIFLPVGIVQIIKNRSLPEVIMLIAAVLLMVIVSLQFSYVLKFFVLGHFFVNFIISLGIGLFLQQISYKIVNKIMYFYLLMVLMVIFILNTVYWKNTLHYQNLFTQISPSELQAAKFLKDKYSNADVLMISDPATQNILETFSGVNSPGGVYANKNTRDKLIKIADATTSAEIKDELYQINDSIQPTRGIRLLILSGRYFQWQMENQDNREALYFNIWSPADLSFNNQKYIQFLLLDPQHFSLVYQNNTLAIVEVYP